MAMGGEASHVYFTSGNYSHLRYFLGCEGQPPFDVLGCWGTSNRRASVRTARNFASTPLQPPPPPSFPNTKVVGLGSVRPPVMAAERRERSSLDWGQGIMPWPQALGAKASCLGPKRHPCNIAQNLVHLVPERISSNDFVRDLHVQVNPR